MDEQVVPGSASLFASLPPSFRSLKPVKSIAKLSSATALVSAAIKPKPGTTIKPATPKAPRSRRALKAKAAALISPAAEYPGKPRWETPRRTGKWKEPWESAREMGLNVCVRSVNSPAVCNVIKQCVSDAVLAHVGPHLPKSTAEKWLCLLCEYLDLNADEQILVVCLLQKYVRKGGRFVGRDDWSRPQRWECVVAIACYTAVLLTEEFPGRTAMDLRELLGPNFKFGLEQVSFLKIIDWRITIDQDNFMAVKETCQQMLKGTKKRADVVAEWFMTEQAIQERNLIIKQSKVVAVVSPPALVAVEKKRGFTAIAPAEESAVPRMVIPHLHGMHVHAVPTMHNVPVMTAAYVPNVPPWAPHWG